MGLLPTTSANVTLDTAVTITTAPTKTYCVDRDTGRIVSMIDSSDAMLQAIIKTLWTQRYSWLIYSWNYGIELEDLVGQDKTYVTSEIKRRVTEALLVDDRITGVMDFAFYQTDMDDLTFTCTVQTIYGDIPVRAGVNT